MVSCGVVATRGLGLVAWLLVFAKTAFPQAAAPPQEMRHRHDDPVAYIASLEDPKRDAYQKPDEVMKALALRPGEVVADIGAGSGYFTLRFARAVGDPAGSTRWTSARTWSAM